MHKPAIPLGRRASLVLFGIFAFSLTLRAQYAFSLAPPPDVLSPEPRPWMLGVIVGADMNRHRGDFLPECEECSFHDGSGTGILAGLQVERILPPSLGVALRVLYDDYRASYTETLTGQRRQVSDGTFATIDVERTMDVELPYLTVNPSVELFMFRNLYLFAGPAVGFPLRSRYRVVERLLDESFVYYETNTNEKVIGREVWTAVPDETALRFDIRAGIGFNVKVGRSVILAPQAMYAYPLTTISSSDKDWKSESFSAALVLKWIL
ncbi:MAG: hypothetical protein QHI48_03700 [Bacteroidota bacterium]|nr:hypothetical protein [Bacteroidota bacterium]